MEQLGSHWMVFCEILCFFSIFKNLSTNITFRYNLTRITGTLHEDRCKFVIISRSILPRMRNVSEKKRYGENQKILFRFNFFSPENRAVYEKMRKNIVQSGRPQITYNTVHEH